MIKAFFSSNPYKKSRVMPDIIDLTINDNASNISATFCL
jgi:hypothetical protein